MILRRAAALIGLISLLGGPAGAWAADLPTARPANAGLSAERLDRLGRFFEAKVGARERAGYVIMVAKDGKVVYSRAIGQRDIASGRPMTLETRFRIASMTKLVTSIAVLMLYEEGRFQLRDPVSMYLPEIGGMRVFKSVGETGEIVTEPPKRPMTIRDLLTHTSGLAYRSDQTSPVGKLYAEADLYGTPGTLADKVARLSELPLLFNPGERLFYSYSTDVLGRLVEVVSGQDLAGFLKQRLFDPVGMASTGFTLDPADAGELATVYRREGGALTPVAGHTFGDPLNPARWPSGGAGLVSTAPDYMRFLLMLQAGGEFQGRRLLSPATIELMRANHLPPAITERMRETPLAGLGFGLGPAVVMDIGQFGAAAAVGDYMWGGFFDTQYFVSPATGLVAIVMSQDEELPGESRRTMGDLRSLVFQALDP